MNKPTLTAFGAAVGLLCAAILLWVWRHEPEVGPVGTAPSAISTAPAVAPTPAPASLATDVLSDPSVRTLISALQQLLKRTDVRRGETVMTFKDDAAYARFLDRAAKAGVTVIGRLDPLRSVRVRIDDLNALRNELVKNASDYEDLSGNYIFTAPQVPTKEARAAVNQVPFGNDTLGFIGATGDRGKWGRGVTIAILDTGVSADPTFGTGRVQSYDIGYGVVPGHGSDDGHGTSVASLAGGMSPDAAGVAPAANLLSIRVTDASGSSDIFTISQAIVTAVDSGAKVINVSLGGYGTNAALNFAIDYAVSRGVAVVAAAGNDQAAQLAWPAADGRVISVGAVDKAEQQVIFSNSGPQLKLTAPGYGVQTAWLDGQRAYVDGTSASAPLVAGAIAALMSQNPSLTPNAAAQLLIRTASDAGAPGVDPQYGYGILNVAAALNFNNPAYVDTAVSSHYYDAGNKQMDFVVQNRGGRAIAGMSLAIAANTTTTNYLIPNLSPGDTTVVRVPVDAAQLSSNGQITYVTTLTNPLGTVDQVPANNRRMSVLTSSPKGK